MSRLPHLFREINRQLRRLPAWMPPYVVSLTALAGGFLVAVGLLRVFGANAAPIVSLLGDLVFLLSAWCGYGPGILVCSLILFVVPPLLTPGRVRHVDLERFGLILFISLLVSRVSASKRRSEALLRQWGVDLEKRVEGADFGPAAPRREVG
ncbi:MAG: DUF4118 domain-containing protein [Ignavibacteriota bacterium]